MSNDITLTIPRKDATNVMYALSIAVGALHGTDMARNATTIIDLERLRDQVKDSLDNAFKHPSFSEDDTVIVPAIDAVGAVNK